MNLYRINYRTKSEDAELFYDYREEYVVAESLDDVLNYRGLDESKCDSVNIVQRGIEVIDLRYKQSVSESG